MEYIATNNGENYNLRKRKNRSDLSTLPKLPNNRPRMQNTSMENMLDEINTTSQNKKTK